MNITSIRGDNATKKSKLEKEYPQNRKSIHIAKKTINAIRKMNIVTTPKIMNVLGNLSDNVTTRATKNKIHQKELKDTTIYENLNDTNIEQSGNNKIKWLIYK